MKRSKKEADDVNSLIPLPFCWSLSPGLCHSPERIHSNISPSSLILFISSSYWRYRIIILIFGRDRPLFLSFLELKPHIIISWWLSVIFFLFLLGSPSGKGWRMSRSRDTIITTSTILLSLENNNMAVFSPRPLCRHCGGIIQFAPT